MLRGITAAANAGFVVFFAALQCVVVAYCGALIASLMLASGVAQLALCGMLAAFGLFDQLYKNDLTLPAYFLRCRFVVGSVVYTFVSGGIFALVWQYPHGRFITGFWCAAYFIAGLIRTGRWMTEDVELKLTKSAQ